MIIKWLQSVVARPEVTSQGASALEPIRKLKRAESDELVDLVHETLKADAQNLEGILQVGSSLVSRRKFKEKVQKKVKSVIAEEFDDPEIVEEVTEKLVNVAENDPYYRKMFDD